MAITKKESKAWDKLFKKMKPEPQEGYSIGQKVYMLQSIHWPEFQNRKQSPIIRTVKSIDGAYHMVLPNYCSGERECECYPGELRPV